jgi:hypothetical protein
LVGAELTCINVGRQAASHGFPFDQLDFAAGALLVLAVFVPLTVSDVALVLVFTFAADIAVNHMSFRAGIRDTPW